MSPSRVLRLYRERGVVSELCDEAQITRRQRPAVGRGPWAHDRGPCSWFHLWDFFLCVCRCWRSSPRGPPSLFTPTDDAPHL